MHPLCPLAVGTKQSLGHNCYLNNVMVLGVLEFFRIRKNFMFQLKYYFVG